MTPLPRRLCTACGRTVPVRVNGALREHAPSDHWRDAQKRCPGLGQARMNTLGITIREIEAPAVGTKRPHRITDTAGAVYKTFDPAIAAFLRSTVGQPVDLEVEMQPGKPGYPAEPFITQATLSTSSPGAGAPPSAGTHIPHAVGDERIESRRIALRCAVELAAARQIAVDRILAAADHFTAWIYEQASGIVLVPLNPDAKPDADVVKAVGAAVPLELISQIAAAGRAAPPTLRSTFYGSWLPEHGYPDYHTFTVTGAAHAQAALEYLGAR